MSALSLSTHMSSSIALKMDKNQENPSLDISCDEIFDIPKKKETSLLKQLSWDEQMYCIQRYLEGGHYPHFYLGAKNREKTRDFRQMVKKTYSIDTDRKVLMKLVNMKKLGSKQWLHKFLLNSTPNCNHSNM